MLVAVVVQPSQIDGAAPCSWGSVQHHFSDIQNYGPTYRACIGLETLAYGIVSTPSNMLVCVPPLHIT
jgi:hypothetical protein